MAQLADTPQPTPSPCPECTPHRKLSRMLSRKLERVRQEARIAATLGFVLFAATTAFLVYWSATSDCNWYFAEYPSLTGCGVYVGLYMSCVPSVTLLPLTVCLLWMGRARLIDGPGVNTFPTWSALQSFRRRGLTVLLLCLLLTLVVTPVLIFPTPLFIPAPGFGPVIVALSLFMFFLPMAMLFYIAVLVVSGRAVFLCNRNLSLLAGLAGLEELTVGLCQDGAVDV